MALSDDEILLLRAAKKIKEFQETEWYTFLTEFINSTRAARLPNALARAGSVEGVLGGEFEKGTIYGIGLIVNTFDETVAQANRVREREAELAAEGEEGEEDE